MEPAPVPPSGPPPTSTTEEERLRAALVANPADFDSHTALLGLVEKEGDAAKLREELSKFLDEYPLCYGFWKKLADAEATAGGSAAAQAVYERGVKAFPNGVELWAHYASHMATGEDTEAARGVFERGAEAVGGEANSEGFWDKYLDFEKGKEEWNNAHQLYKRIVGNPITALDKYWDAFRLLNNKHPPKGKDKREWYKEIEKIYKACVQERDKRAPYESNVKRTYFHVRPLDAAQIKNWHDYLAFEISLQAADGPDTRVRRLYERCLVVCANYPEFWKEYVKYLQGKQDEPAAKALCDRALSVQLKRNAEMHMFVADLAELAGNMQGARRMHEHVVKTVAPGLIEGVLNLSNFERRQGEHAAVTAAFETGISAGGGSASSAFLAVQYARYLLGRGEPDRCREVYKSASESSPDCRQLWEAFLGWEATMPDSEQKVQDIMAAAVGQNTKLDEEDRQGLWQWYLEYLRDFGSSLKKIRENEAAFELQFPAAVSSSNSKKRGLENGYDGEAAKRQAQAQQWGGYTAMQGGYAGYGQ